ncbi:flagellar export chaperone FliS [Noviherbaspirillum massiliense]|uniref:flagellar export chaperone FliS n=1 Tax=Noviherbaspirillum massiliense TaxID=1465823 RepID=UPI00030C7C58|nr:flagellar export chaperone FliS [Noviherbaspirillum massiliense]
MFGSLQHGANAYAKVGIETGVLAASPHKLIVMLFEGATVALSTAIQQMKAGDVAGKGQSISKAIAIIDNGLRASLDKKAGGSIALSLDALYEYMSSRLLTANLKNQPELLEEVQHLLQDLKGAWDAIGTTADPAPQPMPKAPQMPAYETATSYPSRLVKA